MLNATQLRCWLDPFNAKRFKGGYRMSDGALYVPKRIGDVIRAPSGSAISPGKRVKRVDVDSGIEAATPAPVVFDEELAARSNQG
jgi:hypothetical protein